jgi:Tol biopolymer transport system component
MHGRRTALIVLGLLLACACAASSAAKTLGGTGVVSYWSDDPWPSIWTVRPDGSHRTRILRTRQNAKRPRISPDGRWVAFDGTRPGLTPISDFDIQLVRRNGRGLRTLTRSSFWDNDAQWSPDGRLISFSRTTDADWTKAWIWTVRADGTAPRKLARGQFGRWSPDGTRLALDSPTPTSPGDLFIVDADGKNRRLLLSSPELDQPADWSPDGKRILFTRYASTSSRTSIYIVGADGTGLRRLGSGIAGSFSPDGSQIVYTTAFLGKLFVMREDGSHRRAIPGAIGAEPDWR